jgi:hypothetical protein
MQPFASDAICVCCLKKRVRSASPFEVLRFAGAVEDASEDPIAEAVAGAARAELGKLPPLEAFRNLPASRQRLVPRGSRRRLPEAPAFEPVAPGLLDAYEPGGVVLRTAEE